MGWGTSLISTPTNPPQGEEGAEQSAPTPTRKRRGLIMADALARPPQVGLLGGGTVAPAHGCAHGAMRRNYASRRPADPITWIAELALIAHAR
jgi:hypothetical protein